MPIGLLSSQDGRTPLFSASSKGHLELVDRLIAAQAMVNVAAEVVLSIHYGTPACKPQACYSLATLAATTLDTKQVLCLAATQHDGSGSL